MTGLAPKILLTDEIVYRYVPEKYLDSLLQGHVLTPLSAVSCARSVQRSRVRWGN